RPDAVASGRAGVMNTLFVGEAYANFGWLGVFISPLVVGLVIQSIYVLVISQPRGPVNMCIFILMFYSMPITGGFADFIWNPGWIFIFLVLLLSRYDRIFFRDFKVV